MPFGNISAFGNIVTFENFVTFGNIAAFGNKVFWICGFLVNWPPLPALESPVREPFSRKEKPLLFKFVPDEDQKIIFLV